MTNADASPRLTRRADLVAGLAEDRQWDVAIIGGGATGLGVALDAALRGFSVVLIESHDFAKGTSSRATKLVHGGVRYLAQGNMPLVREALHERTHLVAQRAASGPAAGLRDAGLPMVGSPVLRRSASRCTTCWPDRLAWAALNSWAVSRPCSVCPGVQARGLHGRRQVLGRPVRRCTSGAGAGPHGGSARRVAGQLLRGNGSDSRSGHESPAWSARTMKPGRLIRCGRAA